MELLYLVSIGICNSPGRLVLLLVTDISPSQPIFLHVVLIMEQGHHMPVSFTEVPTSTDMCPVFIIEDLDNTLCIYEKYISQQPGSETELNRWATFASRGQRVPSITYHQKMRNVVHETIFNGALKCWNYECVVDTHQRMYVVSWSL